MHQVLSVPPHQGAMIGRFWSKTNRALLLLPLVIQSLVFKNDWQTREYGMALNRANTYAQIGAGVCFWVLTAMLTALCFRVWDQYDAEWKSQSAKLFGPAKQDEVNL